MTIETDQKADQTLWRARARKREKRQVLGKLKGKIPVPVARQTQYLRDDSHVREIRRWQRNYALDGFLDAHGEKAPEQRFRVDRARTPPSPTGSGLGDPRAKTAGATTPTGSSDDTKWPVVRRQRSRSSIADAAALQDAPASAKTASQPSSSTLGRGPGQVHSRSSSPGTLAAESTDASSKHRNVADRSGVAGMPTQPAARAKGANSPHRAPPTAQAAPQKPKPTARAVPLPPEQLAKLVDLDGMPVSERSKPHLAAIVIKTFHDNNWWEQYDETTGQPLKDRTGNLVWRGVDGKIAHPEKVRGLQHLVFIDTLHDSFSPVVSRVHVELKKEGFLDENGAVVKAQAGRKSKNGSSEQPAAGPTATATDYSREYVDFGKLEAGVWDRKTQGGAAATSAAKNPCSSPNRAATSGESGGAQAGDAQSQKGKKKKKKRGSTANAAAQSAGSASLATDLAKAAGKTAGSPETPITSPAATPGDTWATATPKQVSTAQGPGKSATTATLAATGNDKTQAATALASPASPGPGVSTPGQKAQQGEKHPASAERPAQPAASPHPTVSAKRKSQNHTGQQIPDVRRPKPEQTKTSAPVSEQAGPGARDKTAGDRVVAGGSDAQSVAAGQDAGSKTRPDVPSTTGTSPEKQHSKNQPPKTDVGKSGSEPYQSRSKKTKERPQPTAPAEPSATSTAAADEPLSLSDIEELRAKDTSAFSKKDLRKHNRLLKQYAGVNTTPKTDVSGTADAAAQSVAPAQGTAAGGADSRSGASASKDAGLKPTVSSVETASMKAGATGSLDQRSKPAKQQPASAASTVGTTGPLVQRSKPAKQEPAPAASAAGATGPLDQRSKTAKQQPAPAASAAGASQKGDDPTKAAAPKERQGSVASAPPSPSDKRPPPTLERNAGSPLPQRKDAASPGAEKTSAGQEKQMDQQVGPWPKIPPAGGLGAKGEHAVGQTLRPPRDAGTGDGRVSPGVAQHQPLGAPKAPQTKGKMVPINEFTQTAGVGGDIRKQESLLPRRQPGAASQGAPTPGARQPSPHKEPPPVPSLGEDNFPSLSADKRPGNKSQQPAGQGGNKLPAKDAGNKMPPRDARDSLWSGAPLPAPAVDTTNYPTLSPAKPAPPSTPQVSAADPGNDDERAKKPARPLSSPVLDPVRPKSPLRKTRPASMSGVQDNGPAQMLRRPRSPAYPPSSPAWPTSPAKPGVRPPSPSESPKTPGMPRIATGPPPALGQRATPETPAPGPPPYAPPPTSTTSAEERRKPRVAPAQTAGPPAAGRREIHFGALPSFDVPDLAGGEPSQTRPVSPRPDSRTDAQKRDPTLAAPRQPAALRPPPLTRATGKASPAQPQSAAKPSRSPLPSPAHTPTPIEAGFVTNPHTPEIQYAQPDVANSPSPSMYGNSLGAAAGMGYGPQQQPGMMPYIPNQQAYSQLPPFPMQQPGMFQGPGQPYYGGGGGGGGPAMTIPPSAMPLPPHPYAPFAMPSDFSDLESSDDPHTRELLAKFRAIEAQKAEVMMTGQFIRSGFAGAPTTTTHRQPGKNPAAMEFVSAQPLPRKSGAPAREGSPAGKA